MSRKERTPRSLEKEIRRKEELTAIVERGLSLQRRASERREGEREKEEEIKICRELGEVNIRLFRYLEDLEEEKNDSRRRD